MAWRGVLAQHRKLATCEDRRMTTSTHHGITESQHDSSDLKTKQQRCTRTEQQANNIIRTCMYVRAHARMYVRMHACMYVCMCVYFRMCNMSECVWGTPYFCPASGLVPLSGKIRFGASSLSKKTSVLGWSLSVIIITGTTQKVRRFCFFIANLHIIVKKTPYFWPSPSTEVFW